MNKQLLQFKTISAISQKVTFFFGRSDFDLKQT
jgi:hypothetical protein